MLNRLWTRLFFFIATVWLPFACAQEVTVKQALEQTIKVLENDDLGLVPPQEDDTFSRTGIKQDGGRVVFSSAKPKPLESAPSQETSTSASSLEVSQAEVDEALSATLALNELLDLNVAGDRIWPAVIRYKTALEPLGEAEKLSQLVQQSEQILSLSKQCQIFFGGDWEWRSLNFKRLVLGKKLPSLKLYNRNVYNEAMLSYMQTMDLAYAYETYYRQDGVSWNPGDSDRTTVSALPANDGYKHSKVGMTLQEYAEEERLGHSTPRLGTVRGVYAARFGGRDCIYVEKYDTYQPLKMFHRSFYPYSWQTVGSGVDAQTQLFGIRELIAAESQRMEKSSFVPAEEYLNFLDFRRRYASLYDSWFVWVSEEVWPLFWDLEDFFITVEPYVCPNAKISEKELVFYQKTPRLTVKDDPYNYIKPINQEYLNDY